MGADFYLLLPVVILAAVSVAILFLSGFIPSGRLTLVLSLVALAVAGFSTGMWAKPHAIFSDMLRVDPFARLGALMCIGVAAVACCAAPAYLKRMKVGYDDEYFALILAGTAGMLVMIAANDLMVLFVNLEIMSLATYIMCGMNRGSRKSTESALKYFITGAAASALMLFGMALLYGVSGTTNMARIAAMTPAIAGSDVRLFYLLANVCLLVGFLFKIGIVPFHAWLPDVYEGAPTSVTGFMAAGVRVAAAMAFLPVFVDLFAGYGAAWTPILWWCAVLSMCLGNLAAIVQNNVKRMLAYSSIAHAGYLLIGFVGLSGSNLLGAEAVAYYLVSYALMSLGIFIFVGQVEGQVEGRGGGQSGGRRETNLSFDSYRGLGLRQPLAGVLASVLLLSLSGIPPFAGFWAKYSVFATALKNDCIGLAVIGAVNSLISAYYYFRLMVSMYMRESEVGEPVSYVSAPLATGALAVCVFLTLWFGIGPVGLAPFIPSANDLWLAIEAGIAHLAAGR